MGEFLLVGAVRTVWALSMTHVCSLPTPDPPPHTPNPVATTPLACMPRTMTGRT